MATIKTQYGTEAQAITITLASLAASVVGVGRESTFISNLTDLFLDVLVVLRIKTGAVTPTSEKKVYVFAWGSVNVATPIYPDTVTGVDAGITLNNAGVTQLKLIGVIEATVAVTTYTSEPLSIAQAFGGIMPERWGIVVINSTGQTFDATEANFSKQFQGVYGQAV